MSSLSIFLSFFLAFSLSLSLSLSFFFSPRSCRGGDCDKECFLLCFLSTVCFVFREHDDSRGGGVSVSILFVMILGSYTGFHSFKGRRFLGLLFNMTKSDPKKNAHCMKNTWQHLEFF